MTLKALLVGCLATLAGAACDSNQIQMASIQSAAGLKTHSSQACVFPFTYKGAKYTDCTQDGSSWWGGTKWCPYEVDRNGGYIDGKYGDCKFSGGGNGCVEVRLGTKGENACGPADTQIMTEAACKAAAQSLGSGRSDSLKLTWQGVADQASLPNSPNGCFFSAAEGRHGVYFSMKAANAPGADIQQICLKGSCTTASGKSCKFPFVYKGAQYNKCIVSDAISTDAWCPTQLGRDRIYKDSDEYGLCLAACPKSYHCEVAAESKCRECRPESERTGNGQCKSCNAGYKQKVYGKSWTCERVCGDELKLSGANVKNVKGAMGTYIKTSTVQAGRHTYKLSWNLQRETFYLYWYPTDTLEGYWMVGPNIGQNFGSVHSENMFLASSCPEDTRKWHCFDGSKWVACTATVKVEQHAWGAEGGPGTSGACGTSIGKSALAWSLLTISLLVSRA